MPGDDGSRRYAAVRALVSRLVLPALVFVVWQFLVSTERVSPLLLPAPGAVFARLGELLRTSEPWDGLGVTVIDVALAFAVSLTAGLALGVAVGSSDYYAQVAEPLLVALYTIPIIVLYPVITLLFGIGDVSKIVFAGLYGFFPIAANALRGVQTVNRGYLEVAQALGASRGQLRRYVLIPAARPMIMSGIRIGLSLNLVAVVAAQMLASTNGIGYLISNNSQLLNAPDMYAYILLTFVLASIINYALTRGERSGDLQGAPTNRRLRAATAAALDARRFRGTEQHADER